MSDDGLEFDFDPPARVALRRLAPLRELVDALEAALVVRARRDGASWRELGEDLGLTRPGAFRRHRARDPHAERLAARREELRLRNVPPAWERAGFEIDARNTPPPRQLE